MLQVCPAFTTRIVAKEVSPGSHFAFGYLGCPGGMVAKTPDIIPQPA